MKDVIRIFLRGLGVRAITSRGLANGVRGNGIWLAVGLVGLGLRGLGHLRARDQVVYRAVLPPGRRIEIDHLVDTFRDLGVKPPS